MVEIRAVPRRERVMVVYRGEVLAAEIEEGSWYVVTSTTHDVFDEDPARLWHTVLRRQPGELAWVSTRPVDPNQN